MSLLNWRSRGLMLLAAAAMGALSAGCEDQLEAGPGRSLRPISSDMLAQMSNIGVTPAAPVLIRTFKKEAEFEIWKMKSDGRYALLKTFPMCRWSGQLGPKTREGDRQVPEGFYPITPGQMNPNSNYYLSFNVGYPNAYDRAFGRGGGTIMVHGACSSAGCFSMTDAQIADIYAVAREAFNGGQHAIQMQSYPFHMTAENLAKHRLDPNIDFWKQLKNGSDHFEVAHTEPSVAVCGKRYVFDVKSDSAVDANSPCPTLQRDAAIEAAVAAKESHDSEAVAELVARGVKPVRLVYWDGGQNAAFAGRSDVSRPEAIGAPQEVALDERPPEPVAAKLASIAPSPAPHPVAVAAAASSAPAISASAPLAFGLSDIAGAGPLVMKKLLRLNSDDMVADVSAQGSAPSIAPLPPTRDAETESGPPLHLAALKPAPKIKKPLDPDGSPLDLASSRAPAAQ